MTQKWKERFHDQMKKMLSKWERVVELYQNAKKGRSLKDWGIFFFELIKLAVPILLKWVFKKIVRYLFENLW